MDGHAGQVGADLVALAAVRVALGALLLEDHLAGLRRRRSWPVSGSSSSMHLLPVGVGQAAAAAPAAVFARSAIASIGVGGQGLLLVERQVGQLDLCPARCASSSAPVQSGRPSSTRSAAGADGGRQSSPVARRRRHPPRRLALADGLEQPLGQRRRSPRRDAGRAAV